MDKVSLVVKLDCMALFLLPTLDKLGSKFAVKGKVLPLDNLIRCRSCGGIHGLSFVHIHEVLY